MILVTKTSDQTGQRGHTLFTTCTNLTRAVYFLLNRYVCVLSSHTFILDVRHVDAPAGVTQEEGHTAGFLIHLLSCGACLNLYREKDSVIPFPR